jgi:hypothetical protein
VRRREKVKARDNEPTEKDDIIQDLRQQLQNMGSELEAKVVQMQDICWGGSRSSRGPASAEWTASSKPGAAGRGKDFRNRRISDLRKAITKEQ